MIEQAKQQATLHARDIVESGRAEAHRIVEEATRESADSVGPTGGLSGRRRQSLGVDHRVRRVQPSPDRSVDRTAGFAGCVPGPVLVRSAAGSAPRARPALRGPSSAGLHARLRGRQGSPDV
jgi:hypothetical protein